MKRRLPPPQKKRGGVYYSFVFAHCSLTFSFPSLPPLLSSFFLRIFPVFRCYPLSSSGFFPYFHKRSGFGCRFRRSSDCRCGYYHILWKFILLCLVIEQVAVPFFSLMNVFPRKKIYYILFAGLICLLFAKTIFFMTG